MKLYWTARQSSYGWGFLLALESLPLRLFFDPVAYGTVTLATPCCGVPYEWEEDQYRCELCERAAWLPPHDGLPPEDFVYTEPSGERARMELWLEHLTALSVLEVALLASALTELLPRFLSLSSSDFADEEGRQKILASLPGRLS